MLTIRCPICGSYLVESCEFDDDGYLMESYVCPRSCLSIPEEEACQNTILP